MFDRIKFLISAFAVATTLWSGQVFAEAPVAEDDPASREIVVTGHHDDYVATGSDSTKTGTALIDTPQTIRVVTRAQLDDQAQHSLSDVFRYVPGITVGQGEGNRDQITLRGQNSSSDFFVDGVRDDVQYYRGLYNVERIEILKGPAALFFGRGGGGGVVNRVQKAAKFDQTFTHAQASINSFGAYDLAADINGTIGQNVAVRINGNYESLDNHRDFYKGERLAWNPTAAIALGENWRLDFSYEYARDERVADRGIPSLNNVPITGYRDTFFGVPGVNTSEFEGQIATARIAGELASNLTLSASVSYADYDKNYVNVYANGAATAQNGRVALSSYRDPTTRENLIGQAHLVWKVATGPLAHTLLLGAEYGDQQSTNKRVTGVLSNSSFDLANPIFPTVAFSVPARDSVSDVKFFSAYAQDEISIGSHFIIVAGLRYDRFDIQGIDLFPAIDRRFGRTDTKVSPRFGVVYKPQDNVSLYGSYSQTFLPRSGDQFLTLSLAQENLAPEKFVNYEVGAKWDIAPNLTTALALFRLDRSNATTPDPIAPANTINIGQTRTQGVELSLSGQVTEQWQITGGYAYQDAALLGNDTVRLAQVPKHQASLWNRYNFSDALGAGIGVIHQSSQFAAIRTSAAATILPAFTRVDAALFYTVNDRVKVQANIENLFNTNYFSDAHNNNNISTGAPINGRVSVTMKF